jgi:hypothetical protein
MRIRVARLHELHGVHRGGGQFSFASRGPGISRRGNRVGAPPGLDCAGA